MTSREVPAGGQPPVLFSTDQIGKAFGRRSFIRAGLAAAAAPTIFLAACGSDSDTAAAGGGAAAVGGALVVATTRPALGLDPAVASGAPSLNTWISLYDTLFDASTPPGLEEAREIATNGLEVKPMLASEWTSSDDQKTWTIKLQPDAKSAAGNPLSADDVLYSFDRSLSLQYTPAFFLGLVGITKASQFKKVDDKTVELTLPASPPDFFLQILGAPWVCIYDSVDVKKNSTSSDKWGEKYLEKTSAGYGPYKVGTISADGTNVVLNKSEGYWGEAPLDTITLRTLPESSGRAQLLLSGQAHLADDLPPAQLDQVAKNAKTKVVQIATPGFVMLGMKNDTKPFDQPELRRGIAKAIPYDEIIQSAYRGRAERWKTLLPPYFQGATDEFWSYDGDAAAAKTALASFAGTAVELSYSSTSEGQKATAIVVQAALNAAGLKCALNAMDQTSYDTKRLAGELPFYVDDVNTPAVLSSFFAFQQLYVSKPIQPLLQYKNPEFDAVVTELGAERDPAKQNELIKQAQQFLVDDVPAIPVAWTGFNVPAAKAVSGFKGHSLNILYPKDLALAS